MEKVRARTANGTIEPEDVRYYIRDAATAAQYGHGGDFPTSDLYQFCADMTRWVEAWEAREAERTKKAETPSSDSITVGEHETPQ